MYLCKFQCPQIQIIFRFSLLHQYHLTNGLQYSVHIANPHISDPIHINLRIQHHFLKIMVTDNFRQQPGVEFPGFQNINRIITQVQGTQPVSYTHLDVYKRQIICFTRSRRRKASAANAEAPSFSARMTTRIQ